MAFTANVPVTAARVDWSVKVSPLDTGTDLFDLAVQVEEHPDSVDLFFQYRQDIFEAKTVQRMQSDT